MNAQIVYIVQDKDDNIMRVFTDPNLAHEYIDKTDAAKNYETWATDYNSINDEGFLVLD